jgi:hypothetical protein
VFCRKSDPESKGKIENVVKYVKYNFLRGRVFTDIDTLNRDALAWLERTGNGSLHHGTHKVPAEEFAIEKEYLREYKGVPTAPAEHLAPHHVRKDNVINFRGNYYAVPTGTYQGRGTVVYLEEKDDTLHIYSPETGKTLATHRISQGRGALVSSSSLRRDRSLSLEEYERNIRAMLPQDAAIDEYLAELRKRKARNLRDNLQFIAKGAPLYGTDTLTDAFRRCLESSVYNGRDLVSVAEAIRIERKEPLHAAAGMEDPLPRPALDDMTPEKTDLNSFSRLFA